MDTRNTTLFVVVRALIDRWDVPRREARITKQHGAGDVFALVFTHEVFQDIVNYFSTLAVAGKQEWGDRIAR